MSMTVGTSPDVLSYLQSLLQPASSGSAGASDPLTSLLSELNSSSTNNQTGTASAPASGQSAVFSPPLGAGTMSALFSLQGQSNGAQSPSQWFSQLDTNGDGQISQSEFEAGLASKGVSTQTADALFAKLDANSDDTLSQSELAKARHHHHHHDGDGGASQASGSSGQNAINDLLSSVGADGATTQTVTNTDGSTTTTISYADGSTISMTSPATSSGGGTSNGGTGTDNGTGSSNGTNSASNSNLLEKLFQLQSQLLSTAVSTLSTFA